MTGIGRVALPEKTDVSQDMAMNRARTDIWLRWLTSLLMPSTALATVKRISVFASSWLSPLHSMAIPNPSSGNMASVVEIPFTLPV
jgi:hypothetical protein